MDRDRWYAPLRGDGCRRIVDRAAGADQLRARQGDRNHARGRDFLHGRHGRCCSASCSSAARSASLAKAADVKWYYLIGGMLGAAYVTTVLLTVRTLGAGGVTAATVAGQLTMSVMIDRHRLPRPRGNADHAHARDRRPAAVRRNGAGDPHLAAVEFGGLIGVKSTRARRVRSCVRGPRPRRPCPRPCPARCRAAPWPRPCALPERPGGAVLVSGQVACRLFRTSCDLVDDAHMSTPIVWVCEGRVPHPSMHKHLNRCPVRLRWPARAAAARPGYRDRPRIPAARSSGSGRRPSV